MVTVSRKTTVLRDPVVFFHIVQCGTEIVLKVQIHIRSIYAACKDFSF